MNMIADVILTAIILFAFAYVSDTPPSLFELFVVMFLSLLAKTQYDVLSELKRSGK